MVDSIVEEILSSIQSENFTITPRWWISQLEKLRRAKAWRTILLLAEKFKLEDTADNLTKDNWRILDELAIARFWTHDFLSSKALIQCIFSVSGLDLSISEAARLLQNEDYARLGLEKKTLYDQDVIHATKDHDRLAEWLKGKRVVIVGPAPYLEGQGKGKEIDSYDVVIRINKGWQLAEKRPEEFGSRTDVLFHCMEQHSENGGPLPYESLGHVRFICGAIAPLGKQEESTLKGWGSDHLYRLVFAQRRVNKLTPEFCCTNKDWYLKLEERCQNSRPNTGLIAFLDLLENTELKELWITGFTFFKGGYCKDYRNYTEQQVMDRMKAAGNHFQDKQLTMVAPLLLLNNRVRLDQEVRDVLEENDRDVPILVTEGKSKADIIRQIRKLSGVQEDDPCFGCQQPLDECKCDGTTKVLICNEDGF